MEHSKYKFSVIIPVYNVEMYLGTAIESALFQSMDYNNNIQIILIDDGSTDRSGEICDSYARRYPNNVEVLHQPNSGVSVARNHGINHVKGEYVVFLDSDDKISYNTLENVYDFFGKHKDEIDIVSIPVKFFDGRTGEHVLNYKYAKGSRVIDLRKEYDCIQSGIGSVIVKSEVLEKHKFDENLIFAEDVKLISHILLDNPRCGVVANATYFYRRRSGGESTLSTDLLGKEYWYLPNLKNYLYPLAQYAIDKLNYVPRFIQYTIMYSLKWMYLVNLKDVKRILKQEEVEEWVSLIYGLLKYIDDEIIFAQNIIQIEDKAFLVGKKYDTKIRLKISEDSNVAFPLLTQGDKSSNYDVLSNFKAEVIVNGHDLFDLKYSKNVIEFINIKNDNLTLEGYTTFLGVDENSDIKILLSINDEKFFQCVINQKRDISKKRLGEVVLPACTYSGKIENISQYGEFALKIYIEINGLRIERKDLRPEKFFPVVKKYGSAYALMEKWMVRIRGNMLVFSMPTDQQIIFQEESLLREIAYEKTSGAYHAVERRRKYHTEKAMQEQDVWIMSDRVNKSGDNAEALFQYICKEQRDGQKAYFVLNSDSTDYPLVSEYGTVLDYYSDEHLMKHLLADVIISGHFDEHIRNPFYEEIDYYKDILYHKQQVYLQHGVLKDDLTRLINRYAKNLSLIATTAERERDEILTKDYFYDDKVVKLIGSPRFDPLVKGNEKKEIVIAPSWRTYLTVADYSNKDYKIEAAYGFKESEYFCFYNGLINDARLLEAAKKAGYTISFMPHPNIMPFINMFDQHEEVKFYSINKRYYEILSDANLLVTDYSGVSFDFAYLYKPVVYCHFDIDEFYANHSFRKGYFDYDSDGFGEVEYNLDDTVQCLIEYINDDCRLKEEYRKRIDKFFTFHDHNNSARAYQEIRNLSEYVDRNEERVHSRILSDKNAWIELMDKVKNLPADPHGALVYRFPYELFAGNDRVVLYGFGAVGSTFYWQNKQYNFCNIVACIDKNADRNEFTSVPFVYLQDLDEITFDYILIAVTNSDVANSIKESLMDVGIQEKFIKWAGNQYEYRVDEKKI